MRLSRAAPDLVSFIRHEASQQLVDFMRGLRLTEEIALNLRTALASQLFEQGFALNTFGGGHAALPAEADRQGIRSREGFRFGVGALQHLLRNPVYRGEVIWQGANYRGEHEAIIAANLFAQVQAHLVAMTHRRRSRASPEAAILTGLLHDDAGNRMSPSHTNKAGVRYRYYASQAFCSTTRPKLAALPAFPRPRSRLPFSMR